jgi:folate-binding protein YgfZ
MSLEPGQSQETAIAGVRVIVDRQDSLGAPGYELLVDAERVDAVDGAIVAAGEADESLRLRRCGWLACNTARIEAGWPLYLTDFGPDSIPNELGGLLADRVSFTKGCYLGQEVVARIHAQGRPKRLLSAIRFERVVVEDGAGGGISMGDTSGMGGAGEDQRPTTLQPATAMEIYDVPGGTAIGAVTSATLSPMLGDVPIAFAQLRTSAATEGSVVHVDLGVRTLSGTVQGGLRFL